MKLSNINSPFFSEVNLENFFRAPSFENQTKDISCDLSEDKENYYCEVNAPGFSKDNIDIHLEKGQLIVSGKKEKNQEAEGKTYHVRERASCNFRRFFNLPNSINADTVSAKYEQGVLQVKLPKASEAKAKLIKIGD